MRWMHRQVQLVSYSCTCFCCFEVWSCPTIHREPTRCSRLAEHARHPGAIAARLGSKQRPRAARAEAARAGRWWRWLGWASPMCWYGHSYNIKSSKIAKNSHILRYTINNIPRNFEYFSEYVDSLDIILLRYT